MKSLHDLFTVKVTKDQLRAELDIYEEKFKFYTEKPINYKELKQFIEEHKITYGINEAKLKEISNDFSPEKFPVTIAKGVDKKDGQNGRIKFQYDMSTEVDRSKGWNFKEVMRIPTVQFGEKLATIVPPTEGKYGITVFGTKIAPKPGKRAFLKAGKNVTFNEKTQSFYAMAEGQISVKANKLHVFTVYEVPESISMKVGNIDFVGTVIIRGDVPSGFSVKAAGDIKIYGLVEAAHIVAEGSIYISEGLAGLKEGIVEAGEDLHISYINQGIVRANNIFVENSILHSECSAVNDIICQQGNIIGGNLSSGGTIIGKDIGNKLNTVTTISFGVDLRTLNEQKKLENDIEKLYDHLKKMHLLQTKLESSSEEQSTKNKLMMVKLKRSISKSREQLIEMRERLAIISANLGDIDTSQLIVKRKIYPNVIVSFGKYQRTIDRDYREVIVGINKNDIVIHSNH